MIRASAKTFTNVRVGLFASLLVLATFSACKQNAKKRDTSQRASQTTAAPARRAVTPKKPATAAAPSTGKTKPTTPVVTRKTTRMIDHVPVPSVASLRRSFWRQVPKASSVTHFHRVNVREGEFSGGSQFEGYTLCKVRLNSAKVEPFDSVMKPYRGTINATWWCNGKVVHFGFMAETAVDGGLRQAGLTDHCFALWGKNTRRWHW